MTKQLVREDKPKACIELESVQLALKGMWTDSVKGCPHKRGMPEGPDVYTDNEMRPCIYSLAPKLRSTGCEIFKAIIR